MIYIIPVKAETIEDTIQVDDELGVAKYFLANDNAVTISQRLLFAIFSDYILNLFCALIKVVHLTFAWVKGTLSRMSCKGEARWKAKSCIGTCLDWSSLGR